jgi:hypothetical protein
VSSIDQLLARAELIKGHRVPTDVTPTSYGRRRCACACESDDDFAYSCAPATTRPGSDATDPADPATGAAASHLHVLCEAVINRTAAAALTDLVTETLPAPHGARLVGCILHLTDDHTSARMWWQYAAGAGDNSAGYLLYLQHLSQGETAIAEWWLDQTGFESRAQDDKALTDGGIRLTSGAWPAADLAMILRVLSHMIDPDAPARREEVVSTVVDYVVSAVAAGIAANPGGLIPLPPDFAEHLNLILAPAARPGAIPRRTTRPRVLVGDWLEPPTPRAR